MDKKTMQRLEKHLESKFSCVIHVSPDPSGKYMFKIDADLDGVSVDEVVNVASEWLNRNGIYFDKWTDYKKVHYTGA